MKRAKPQTHERLTVWLSSDLVTRLRVQCATDRRSLSSVVLEGLAAIGITEPKQRAAS
jgi:hypothetical protein